MNSFLKLSSFLFAVVLIASCSNPYKHLQLAQSAQSARQYIPVFDRILYRCTVNGRFLFKKYHISGLLLFKELENGTVRAIYQNEMGLTFFDFEWNGEIFQLNKIIEQLNKPALVKVLKKDMELLLMKNLDWEKEKLYLSRGNEQFYCLNIKDGGLAYYIERNKELVRIENAGKTKVITMLVSGKGTPAAMPEQIFIDHHKANFTIELEKLEQDVNE